VTLPWEAEVTKTPAPNNQEVAAAISGR